MVHYKLTYLPIRGLGEPIRMILNYAKQPFEDVRVPFDAIKALKPNLPYGQVPLLEVDGKPLAQSFAIYRYLARQFGLAGKDDFEAAKLDEIADFLKDLTMEIREWFDQMFGIELEDKDKFVSKKLRPTLERLHKHLEKTLDDSGSGFLARKGVTWLDFFVTERMVTMHKAQPELYETHPKLLEYIRRVHNLPQLKEYIANRPDTEW
ncbi:Nagst-1 protein [Aphelenchoides avenae]|nr:Nagst-1 protein [Aphelenchus avenae]